MVTGKLSDNIRLTKSELVSGVDRMFKTPDSAFKHVTDRLNPIKKNETGSPYLGPLRKRSLGVLFVWYLDHLPQYGPHRVLDLQPKDGTYWICMFATYVEYFLYGQKVKN